jgi:hypothetical protein
MRSVFVPAGKRWRLEVVFAVLDVVASQDLGIPVILILFVV